MNPFHRFRESHLSPLEIRFDDLERGCCLNFFAHPQFQRISIFFTRAIHSIIPVTKVSMRLIQSGCEMDENENEGGRGTIYLQALTASRIPRALDSF